MAHPVNGPEDIQTHALLSYSSGQSKGRAALHLRLRVTLQPLNESLI